MELFNIMDSGALMSAVIFWYNFWLISGLIEWKKKERPFQALVRQIQSLCESTSQIALARAARGMAPVLRLLSTCKTHAAMKEFTHSFTHSFIHFFFHSFFKGLMGLTLVWG